MRLKILIVFVAVTFAACNAVDTGNRTANNPATPVPAPSAAAHQHQGESIPRVTTAELENLMKDGKVIVVDVRNKASWDIGHIRGSKLIPVTEIGGRTGELPRDKMIVTYCS
ncbi:MAG TPA: rhodanese-like domain-containing protein [Pyrinomonadaceae bacterium]|nr:rhodanese-like domain-containing protein [Pyrinomonadaceae bacterium]